MAQLKSGFKEVLAFNDLSDMPDGDITVGNVTLVTGDLLDTPVNGTIEYYNNRFYITSSGVQRAIGRSGNVLTSDITCENTTTETTILTDNLPSNSLIAGRFSKLIASGIVSNASTADEVTIRVYLDTDVIASITNPASNLNDDCFMISGHTTIRSTGVSGSYVSHIKMEIGDETTISCNSGTIDTTGSNDIKITAQWNNAKVGNVLTLKQSILEFKN